LLQQFKNFNADRINSIEELVELAAYGRALRSEYEQLSLDEPEFLDIQLKAVRREIHARNADKLEANLKELKARRDALKSPMEKRAEINKQIQNLEKELQKV
jgi:hypothetical protein